MEDINLTFHERNLILRILMRTSPLDAREADRIMALHDKIAQSLQ